MAIKPIFELKNMDCLEYLKTIKDESISLVLIDPPYEISKTTNFRSGEATGKDTVTEMQTLSTMFSKVGNNDLKSFKRYLEENKETVDESVSIIRYRYDVSPMIYIKNQFGINQVNPSKLISSLSGTSGMMSMMQSSSSSVFNEMLDDDETLKGQYQVLAGKWPENYNEMLLVLNDPNTIPDLLVYSLGLRDSKELQSMMSTIMQNKPVENPSKPLEFTYEDLLNLEYKLVDPTDTYKYNAEYNIYSGDNIVRSKCTKSIQIDI